MAVKKPHAYRGFVLNEAYWRPNKVSQDLVCGEVAFDIEVYANAASRKKASQVHARFREALADATAKRAAHLAAEQNALDTAKANPHMAKRKQVMEPPKIVYDARAAAEEARLAHDAAQEEYLAADQARTAVGPVEVHHRALAPEVAAKLIADKATHDEIVAAIYAQEKADGLLLAGGEDA